MRPNDTNLCFLSHEWRDLFLVHRRLLPAEKNGLELSYLVHGNADRTHCHGTM